MGLDNYIHVSSTKPIVFPRWFHAMRDVSRYYSEQKYAYEAAYWRKCWNIRDRMFSCISTHEVRDQYKYELTSQELLDFVEELKTLVIDGEEEWDNSIWEFHEELPCLLDNITQLTWIADYMEENPDIKVTFYDSY